LTAAPFLHVFGDTVFLASDGKSVVVCNNADSRDSLSTIEFVQSTEGKYGRVLFGYEKAYPQGGMNERGLFFDGIPVRYMKVSRSEDKLDYDGFLALKALEECATVDEVMELFSRYNLDWLAYEQLMFGDSLGNSVIVEGDSIIHKTGTFQVATNFYQSTTTPRDRKCARFRTASKKLSDLENVTIDGCRDILEAVSVRAGGPVTSATIYSTVYDLRKGLIYLYYLSDFEHPKVFHIDDELAGQGYKRSMKELFGAKISK